ncbi:PEGA domain-containing protein, partial [bacterium]|nr:PEGA domain-containing protein [bacterium]
QHGDVKLIDFGIASVKRHRSDANKDKKVRGKIPYMSPEQIIKGNQPDHRSDLFSLGLVLYEALTHERLFRTQEELLSAGKNPRWLARVIKEKKLNPGLEKILSKAMEVDISERYQSANHLYIDLMQYLISTSNTAELADNLSEFVSTIVSGETPPIWTDGSYSASSRSPLQTTGTAGYRRKLLSSDGKETVRSKTPRIEGHTSNSDDEYLESEPKPERWPRIKKLFKTRIESTTEFEIEEDEDLKTVIDMIRISARNNKRRIVFAGTILLIGVLIFCILDVMKSWSPMGTWLSDRLFPPAIEIVTTPPNARISLDGEEISSRAPAIIREVAPGVHKLQLELPGYKPIVKSLFVPRKGAVRVEGEANAENRKYHFSFKTEVELTSNPPGAHIILNGIRYNQKTPCTVSWEIGTPLSIELEQTGFERLAGFSLNTLEGIETVEDRRYWNMQVTRDEIKHYTVHGVFRKKIYFETVPSGVEIFDENANRVLGVTGSNRKVSIPAGTHQFSLRKKGFLTQKMNVVVAPNSEKTVKAVLNRRVKFLAFDKGSSRQGEIDATLVSLKRGPTDILKRKRTTPFEMTLPAYMYTAILQKSGYQKREVKIQPGDHLVKVAMEPLESSVEIKVLDATSKSVISDAEIHYNYSTQPLSIDRFFDLSDTNGRGVGRLTVGQYVFKIKKKGFADLTQSVTIHPEANQIIVLKLQPVTSK